ncbi:hypothetical protein IWC96_05615 [Brevundimonas sp. BAL450]|uniref:Uncharacterized protein n=1 Tax=Brevundimonas abyssalis TAR-001 TaxID=1391729 RepID=A0A8E0N8E0_9CAUL|nr:MULTISPECIES: hypothetical protein [Brevundimonas]MBG7614760.1 hypothetical protein [Brevundimonas sp. BAL450]GAD58439.1 hypothetical protein MBEBAB_0689 [Brevundimonas abyssalis TAR-001]
MARTAWIAAAAALVSIFASFASAQSGDEDDILDQVINSPPVQSWQVTGLRATPRPVRAQGVLGDQAIRVAVPRPGANPWDIAGRMSIAGEISQGDTILLAVWARTHTPPDGQRFGVLSGIRVEQSVAPYTAIAQDSAVVPSEWTMVYASGVAQQDYPGGSTNVSVHLASAAQTIELGPAFVLNLGQDYDPAQLPRNVAPE